MLFTKRCSYAVLALAYMARDSGQIYRVQEIADAMSLPFHFLGQIMRELSKRGFLHSSKGKSGGFSLTRPSIDYSLLAIRGVIDGNEDLGRCLFCTNDCSSKGNCSLLSLSEPICDQLKQQLKTINLRDVAELIFDNTPKGREVVPHASFCRINPDRDTWAVHQTGRAKRETTLSPMMEIRPKSQHR